MTADRLTYDEWAEQLRDGTLLGQACTDCDHVWGTPKGACPDCGSRNVETVELPEDGTVYTETTVAVPPEEFDERNYQVVIVAVGDARVMGRLDGEAAIGDPVTFDGAFENDDHPVPLFVPA